MSWLLRESSVVASLEIAQSRQARTKGLLGRTELEGAFMLDPCRQVHTVGMRFPIDVCFLDKFDRVLKIRTLAPWRLSPIVLRARRVIEAPAGAFKRWNVSPGDKLEVSS